MTAAAAAAVMAASERRIARQFREAGATSPATAIAFEAERRIDGRRIEHLIRSGVIHEAGPGFYWLDEDAWATRYARRRSVILIMLAVMLAIFGAIFLFAQTR